MIFESSIPHKLAVKYSLEALAPKQGDEILDIGCGIGNLCRILSEKGSNVFGIDIDQDALREAKKVKGTFSKSSITNLRFKANFFDKINATCILEHIPPSEIDKSLEEIHRVSKNNATVIITVPCTRGIFNGTKFNRLGHDNKERGEYHYVDGFSPAELKELLINKRIHVENIKYTQFLLSEIIVELAKIYLFIVKKKKYQSQADVLDSERTGVFKAYKLFFYPLYAIAILEDILLAPLFGGHIMVIKGRIQK